MSLNVRSVLNELRTLLFLKQKINISVEYVEISLKHVDFQKIVLIKTKHSGQYGNHNPKKGKVATKTFENLLLINDWYR